MLCEYDCGNVKGATTSTLCEHYALCRVLCCKSILYFQNIRTLVKAAGRDMAGHAPPMDNVAIVVQRDCVAKRATRGMVVTDTWVLMDNMSVSKT